MGVFNCQGLQLRKLLKFDSTTPSLQEFPRFFQINDFSTARFPELVVAVVFGGYGKISSGNDARSPIPPAPAPFISGGNGLHCVAFA
jgi:hypothetical protein